MKKKPRISLLLTRQYKSGRLIVHDVFSVVYSIKFPHFFKPTYVIFCRIKLQIRNQLWVLSFREVPLFRVALLPNGHHCMITTWWCNFALLMNTEGEDHSLWYLKSYFPNPCGIIFFLKQRECSEIYFKRKLTELLLIRGNSFGKAT